MSSIDNNDAPRLQEAVARAFSDQQPLRVIGHASKARWLPPLSNAVQMLSVSEHVGVEQYAPDELVVTVRAGTPLAQLRAVLSAQRQMLAFDPPEFDQLGTVGGAIAAGIAGPARPWRGGVRDAVLGVELLNGMGERLHFGGQVMKNVAGYDLSRLQVGACGTLGVLLSVSLRLAPLPLVEATHRTSLATEDDAYAWLRRYALGTLPVTALSFEPSLPDAPCHVRLSGPAAVVAAAAADFGPRISDADLYWQSLRDQRHSFFATRASLWRVSLPLGATDLELPYPTLVEWGGALRWLQLPVDHDPQELLTRVQALGGHCRRYGSGQGIGPVVPAAGRALLQRLQTAFDSQHILNPGLDVHAN
jgi:glycolate oxidase FAD binding subunit